MKAVILACLLLVSVAARGSAAVSLDTDLSGTTLLPGQTFEVILRLQITGSEEVESISYYWEVETDGSEFFRLTERDTSGSLITWMFHDNAAVEAAPGNLLDPVNALNLGGLTEDDPLVMGTWLVATYTFQIDPLTPAGTYILATYSPAGTGWTNPPPGAQNFAFSQQAAFTVTVVPEPAAVLLVLTAGALGLAGMLRRYRESRANSRPVRPFSRRYE